MMGASRLPGPSLLSRFLAASLATVAAGGFGTTIAQTVSVARAATFPAGLSLDQAVKMAEQRFNARVVRAEAQREGDRTLYVLRLLNDAGHVWTVKVNATTGAVL